MAETPPSIVQGASSPVSNPLFANNQLSSVCGVQEGRLGVVVDAELVLVVVVDVVAGPVVVGKVGEVVVAETVVSD